MKRKYVSYSQALKLKRLGFKNRCNSFYWMEDGAFEYTNSIVHENNDDQTVVVSAPSLSQAQEWLREEKGVHIIPLIKFKEGKILYTMYIAADFIGFPSGEEPEEYNISLLTAIDEALKVLINKSNK